MKYVLFAFAVLLLLIGAYCVYTGLPIIEVERGWASVISGTMAVVGGALLFGIGWVVKTLEQLRAAVAAGEKSGVIAAPAPSARDFRSDETSDERQVVRADAAAPVAWPPHTSPAPTAQEQDETRRPVYAPRTERRQEVRQEVRHEVREEVFEEDDFATEAESILRTPLTEDDRPVREQPATHISDLWRRNGKPGDKKNPLGGAFQKPPAAANSVIEPRPKPSTAANGPQPLDDEFASADGAENGNADWYSADFPAAANAEQAPDPAPAEFETYETAVNRNVAPPTAANAVRAEDDDEAEEPAVIGHYEAEGTSYTMFSDGSIEAQSERGVARFKSMAELKAYFETLETP
jgi:hypothetical protein